MLAAAHQRITALLAPLGQDAPNEATWLITSCLKIDRAQLIIEPDAPLSETDLELLESWALRRAQGEPLAYLCGLREFWSLELSVNANVLVPRSETELLVELALARGDVCAASQEEPIKVIDLGTGSGAIALALRYERPHWRISALDQSVAALEVAQKNARQLNLIQIQWLHGHWFVPLRSERFNLIASNPPYIAGDDPVLEGDSLRFEPRLALTPGRDSLAALRHIIQTSPKHLYPGGILLLEHGTGQGSAVRSMLVDQGFSDVGSHSDLAGHDRVSEGRFT